MRSPRSLLLRRVGMLRLRKDAESEVRGSDTRA